MTVVLEAQRARLEQLLHASEELICIAPALHTSADGLRKRCVWIGIGKARSNENHFVFIFARTHLACLRSVMEGIYCVLPIVENVKVEIEPKRCTFSWRSSDRKYQSRSQSTYGDLFIEDVRDPSGTVMKMLHECYIQACEWGLLWHEGQKANHPEICTYSDYVPLDLAKLPMALPNSAPKRRAATSASSAAQGRNLRLLCVTWNVGATLPSVSQTLGPILEEEPYADVVCVGLQEVCQLSAMRLVQDGDEADIWKEWIRRDVKRTYADDLDLLGFCHLVGMLIVIFVRRCLRSQITDVRTSHFGVGVAGVAGNKGAVGVRMDLDDTSLCFINAHLAAGQEHYIQRCEHFRNIMHGFRFVHSNNMMAESGSGDQASPPSGTSPKSPKSSQNSTPLLQSRSKSGAHQEADRGKASLRRSISGGLQVGEHIADKDLTIQQHDHIFWMGDMNSRLHWPGKLGGMPISQAARKVQEKQIGELLALDQLNMMRREGLAFDNFQEHRIQFFPSYKWRPDADELDMRSQKHVPAWCDRVLFRSQRQPTAEVDKYDIHLGLRQSDHRPVFACLSVPFEGGLPSDESMTELGPNDSDGHAEAPLLSLSHREIIFHDAKPDVVPQEVTLRLTFNGNSSQKQVGRARFRVRITRPTAVASRVSDDIDSAKYGEEDNHMVSARSSTDETTGHAAITTGSLVRALSAHPWEGALEPGKTVEVRLSLNLCEGVLVRRALDATLIVKLNTGVTRDRHYRVPVHAFLEPSIMRLPLEALAGLGRRALLDDRGSEEDATCRAGAAAAASGLPKEIFTVMQFVLERSAEAAPGSLDWWPDPLMLEKKGREPSLVQQAVEHGQPLPEDVTCRGAVQLLLQWISKLPEPIIGQRVLKLSTAVGPAAALRTMAELPRAILVSSACLVARLAARHGRRNDAPARLAERLAQLRGKGAENLVAEVERMMEQVISDLGDAALDSCHFPPRAAALSTFAAGPLQGDPDDEYDVDSVSP